MNASNDPGAPRSTIRNTLIVMAGTLGSRLSGVVRQQILNLFGNQLLEAFLVASRVPNLFRELLAEGALVNSFIPVYKSLPASERRAFAGAFSGTLIGINLLLVALGVFFAPWLVQLLLSDQPTVDPQLAVFMTRLVMPFLMLISLSSIAMGLLNADEHFRESSFAPVAFNVASILVIGGAYFLNAPNAALWLGVGWTVGGLAQLVVQLPALRRFGLLPAPRLGTHPALGRVLLLMAPFALTTSARQFLNVFVTRLLSNAHLFPAGAVSGYANAETMFTMANGLFVVSPALAFFPRFAAYRAQGDWDGFRQLTLSALRLVTFLAAPVSALLVALAPYAISVLNLRGNVPQDRFIAGTDILTGWAVALVPWAINTILLRTFYARERTRDAVLISTVSFVLEVALYYVLTPRLGYYGFGTATTIMGTVTAVALVTLYRRQLGFPVMQLVRHLTRVIPMAVAAGFAAWLVTHVLPAPGQIVAGLIGCAVAGGVGGVVYLGLAVALRMQELQGVLRRFRR